MFDRTEIRVKAGNGGDGAISFRHEKFVPFGGPDGGDGGSGGAVILEASSSVTNLRTFKQNRFLRAGDGKNGRGKKQHGKKGKDLVVTVPVGTVVLPETQIGGEALIADLEQPAQQVVVARGGKGGLGNTHFTSATNQAPKIAQKGEVGEEKSIVLELKLIADVGIIGYPNVGKSTLLAAITSAKPEIASYPFTTRAPVLGVVEVGEQNFVLAEIPGLIDGAHLGRGLGHDFLRHVARTKVLVHLIDGSAASPVEGMGRVNTELSLFDSELGKKPQIVAVNKIDLPEAKARLAEIRNAFNALGTSVIFISAVTGEGVSVLITETLKRLSQVTIEGGAGEKVIRRAFHPKPSAARVSVRREGDTFVVVAPELERIIARVEPPRPEVYSQIRRQVDRLGVSQALRQAGARPGDKVRCGKLEWDWF